MALTFYRIVRTDPPSRRDFLPAAKTKPELPAPADLILRDLWEHGVSVYATEQQARRKARSWAPRFPLGTFIARLEIPDGAPVRADKTLGTGTTLCEVTRMRSCLASSRSFPFRRYAFRRYDMSNRQDLSTLMYELWDLRSGNAIAGFESKAQALAAVRELVNQHGRTYVAQFSLVREDERGETTPVAEGPALADLATASTAHPKPTPSIVA